MSSQPWANVDPNSEHQRWSRWTFTIADFGSHPPRDDVIRNAIKWLRQLFGNDSGHVRVVEYPKGWQIVAEIEGPDADDPACLSSVRRQFKKYFVARGWGSLAVGAVDVKKLAGFRGDKPRNQLVVLPKNSIC